MDQVEIQELSDSDLEGAAGGALAASLCCCSTTGGNCSNSGTVQK